MKVVINVGVGGFNLSQAALRCLVDLGVPVGDYGMDYGIIWIPEADRSEDEMYDDVLLDSKEGRADPRVIQVVEAMGPTANGRFAHLKVIEIPFESMAGWYVDACDTFVGGKPRPP